VLIIVLGISLTVATPAINAWKRVSEKGQAIEEGNVALSYLIKDLEAANHESVQISENRITFQTTGNKPDNISYEIKNNEPQGIYRSHIVGKQEAITEPENSELIAIGVTGLSCEQRDPFMNVTLTMLEGTTFHRKVYFMAETNWVSSL